MAQAMIMPKKYFFDDNGNPLAFGKVYTYAAGTTDPQVTWVDELKSAENTNPIILNEQGYAEIYLDGSYNIEVFDANDDPIWTADPVSSLQEKSTVDSIADLTAIDVSTLLDGSVIIVKGYASPSDGGGGMLYWDASSTETPTLGNYFQADSGEPGRFIRILDGTPLIEMWGCLPSNADNSANLQAVQDSGLGKFTCLGGTYPHDSTIFMKDGILIEGNGTNTTIFDGSGITSGPNFHVTGGVANFLNSGGLKDVQLLGGFTHQLLIDDGGSGGGIGEDVTFDNIRFQSSGGDGLHLDGNSAPVQIGRISAFGCTGNGCYIQENVSTVVVDFISGDENLYLCQVDSLNTSANVWIKAYKSERRSAGLQDDVFRITNAVGGRIKIGRGTVVNQDASTPNSVVRVVSGSSIVMQVDPVGDVTGLGPSYPLGIDNDITSRDIALSDLKIGSYQTERINMAPNFSGASAVPIIWDERVSIAAVSSGNTMRVNHASDGATTTTNFEVFNNTTKTFGVSNSGSVTTLSNIVCGGTIIRLGTTTVDVTTGAGTPESVVTANQGSIYLRNNGGAAQGLYVKESGSGNTGWVAK